MFNIRRHYKTFSPPLLRKCLGRVGSPLRRTLATRAESRYGRLFWGSVVAGSLGAGLAFVYTRNSLDAKTTPSAEPVKTTPKPLYSRQDVANHNSLETGIWVSYDGHVYDITEFIPQHPGGDKIILAAGGALEPFWAMYGVHKEPGIIRMLNRYHIGELKVEDRKVEDVNDPYSDDPDRHPSLLVRSKKPFNAETPLALVGDSLVTPNELFYVRNHLPVPDVDPKTYRLEVEIGGGGEPLELTLDDLKTKFKQYTFEVAIQCAGNRRKEMNTIEQVKGLTWGEGAIGNARWTGVRLRDVLLSAGYTDNEQDDGKHLQFEGLDCDITNHPYGASINLGRAMDPRNDVLIAFAMNGEDIPKDHGYPVRLIVPGVVGARQVKWLSRIIVSDEESFSHWQRNDYKGFSPCTNWDTVDFKSAPPIIELPVQSAICEPGNGAVLEQGTDEVTVKGYAWSGGGREIIRVDVSADGGKNWQVAELTKSKQPTGRHWGWTLWQTTIPVNNRSEMSLCCKAIDSSYNCQPDSVGPIWNLRGVLSTAWHRVNVTVPSDED